MPDLEEAKPTASFSRLHENNFPWFVLCGPKYYKLLSDANLTNCDTVTSYTLVKKVMSECMIAQQK